LKLHWRDLLTWESLTLTGICLADMVSTLHWVHTSVATEMNPWMSLWLQHGDGAFCLMKLLSFLPLLFLCAYYRPKRPRLVAAALRSTIVLYILLYASMVGMQFLTV
jgi:prepilin signal peptidase PulO-like enzyme (type II secretory pathway)